MNDEVLCLSINLLLILPQHCCFPRSPLQSSFISIWAQIHWMPAEGLVFSWSTQRFLSLLSWVAVSSQVKWMCDIKESPAFVQIAHTGISLHCIKTEELSGVLRATRQTWLGEVKQTPCWELWRTCINLALFFVTLPKESLVLLQNKLSLLVPLKISVNN